MKRDGFYTLWANPSLEKSLFRLSTQGIEKYIRAGLVRIDNKGGTLFCQTLFPEDYLIRKVGGSATVTPAKADPGNKGNATLKDHNKRKI